MTARLITDRGDFRRLCRQIHSEGVVAFDTEFVSDYTYRPELGLLQFATSEKTVAVDPLAVTDLSEWWEIMADEETTVVVHGGQAEVRFCLRYTGKRPSHLIDVQLAEGLRCRSYPLSYSALVNRVLGRNVHGKETRTDWRRRPLSDRQIDYALEDVEHVLAIWESQLDELACEGRLEWARAEFERMINDIEAEAVRPNWERLSGLSKLNPRELAVVREIADWREEEAACRDVPVRRVLRDDLIVDLARRRPGTVNELLSMRDMRRNSYRSVAADLLACVERGLGVPDSKLPTPPGVWHSNKQQDEQIIGQLLGLALAGRCAEAGVSRQLVGTTADLRELVRWHFSGRTGDVPRLATGWRAEVCGRLLTNVLEGRVAMRVGSLGGEQPLVFEQAEDKR